MKDKRWRWLRVGPLSLVLTAALASSVLGQAVSATITGTITDTQGAILKGATVVAVNTKTGVEHPAKSNDAGVYTITGLQTGTYTVKAESPGFKSTVTNP